MDSLEKQLSEIHLKYISEIAELCSEQDNPEVVYRIFKRIGEESIQNLFSYAVDGYIEKAGVDSEEFIQIHELIADDKLDELVLYEGSKKFVDLLKHISNYNVKRTRELLKDYSGWG